MSPARAYREHGVCLRDLADYVVNVLFPNCHMYVDMSPARAYREHGACLRDLADYVVNSWGSVNGLNCRNDYGTI